ncbi:F0F1 ATP synthase subunit epsilon [Desulfitobacterium sp.]|uniref:F0F1 ATP synthase subunit epsilon n=1 Tax=Desulfitobacterium sp. TaxID=49981 RepID=UPI002C693FF6|nr:F0F1 ATP synthase subunit epsilon [Desulfitobacterium sp.]HVJ49223.1 F0F1 ATP synthase subunit epsilon [Desulfitobacterium sp.]
MAGTFTFHVVSPEGNVLKEEIEFVILPGVNGELGILPNHAPLIAALDTGVIRYTIEGKKKNLAISGGFVEVSENKATVLADTAESGELIDLQRAQAAKERAEKRLAQRSPDIDIKRAEFALHRAIARINAADRKND